MALVTRCPNCHRAFKVVPDQLRVRNGLVRCGDCGTVFDGRACLEGEAPAAPAPLPQAAARVALPSYVATSQASALANIAAPEAPAVLRGRERRAFEPGPDEFDVDEERAADVPEQVDIPPANGSHLSRHEVPDGDDTVLRAYDPEEYGQEPEFTVGGASENEPQEEGERIYGDVRTRYSSAIDVGRAPPEFLDQDRIQVRRTRRRGWAWLCLLGLLALAGQLAYVYRTPIAIAAPMLRPLLASACRAAGCTVGYARRIERVFIESSSLRPPQGASQADEDGHSRLILAAVLHNRYDRDQEWPALTLSLTDMSDTVIARKVIPPEAYLPAGTTGPMAAGAEVTISVPIQVTGLQVNGYQLDKFFP